MQNVLTAWPQNVPGPWSKCTMPYMGVGHQQEIEADGKEEDSCEVWQ